MLLRSRTVPARRPLLQVLLDQVAPAHLAVARAGAGAVMLGRPTVLPRLLGADSATATRTAWVVQMLGAREVAMGLGTLAALQRGDRAGSRLWVAAGVLCDGLDALAVGAAVARGRVRPGIGLLVAGTAAGAAALGVREVRPQEVAPL